MQTDDSGLSSVYLFDVIDKGKQKFERRRNYEKQTHMAV